MSDYYKSLRDYNIFKPGQSGGFKISRSKIDLFKECPRCFYMDCRLGVSRPPGFPFTLNSAVDKLLKKEFDTHRVAQTSHPLMEEYGIDAVPFQDKRIDEWRDTRRGIQFVHEPTNLLIMGAIDDIWVNPKGELHIVDYKATSKAGEVNLDADWQIGYKRQMEVYQWLFRQNGFNVSDTGYFVYCNGRTDTEAFDKKIEFNISVIPYKGDDSWVEGAILDIKKCLEKETIPDMASDCDYCNYRKSAAQESYKFTKKKK
ncbi:MAG: PD-(D/E)XK nuclease family protein [Candidatus Parcubacteria bacterium]|nr:PD-(D/E)XK nuclease family protein [Candidatus Parcubacteria bacterium]